MARFHSLSVTDVKKTIRDAVVVTFKADDPDAFAFTQGQYMTLRRDFDGEELRRSYSICSGLDDGNLQVGIKKLTVAHFQHGPMIRLKWATALTRCRQWAHSTHR